MYSYQPLKADEVKFVLVGLHERLEKCPRGDRDPVTMLDYLKRFVEEVAALYYAEMPAFTNPAFGLDSLNRLGVIMSYLALIEEEYLPAVAHHLDEERALRSIFLRAANRLGLDWIKDLVVHSSGRLAIYPQFFNVLDIPVFHVQANFLDKCLSLPGAFHEFGHSVFLRFGDFLAALRAEVDAHFDALKKGIGPVPEDQRQRIVKGFEKAQAYWNESRLAELFCDLFAQYVSGCANMISMVDLCMGTGQPPWDTEIENYPPNAARVRVCQLALTSEQAASDEMKNLFADWNQYADFDRSDSTYREFCNDKLLNRFTSVVLQILPQLMPNTQRNVKLMPKIDAALAPYESLTFEEATERAMAVLINRPEMYDSWWREARDKLV